MSIGHLTLCSWLLDGQVGRQPAPANIYFPGKHTHKSWEAASSTHLFNSFILWGRGAVVGVLLRACIGALPHLSAFLMLVGQFFNVPICFPTAQAPHRTGEPLPQGVARALGARGALSTDHVGLKRSYGSGRTGVIAGDRKGVWKKGQGEHFKAEASEKQGKWMYVIMDMELNLWTDQWDFFEVTWPLMTLQLSVFMAVHA